MQAANVLLILFYLFNFISDLVLLPPRPFCVFKVLKTQQEAKSPSCQEVRNMTFSSSTCSNFFKKKKANPQKKNMLLLQHKIEMGLCLKVKR